MNRELAELENVLFSARPDDVIAAVLFKMPEKFMADEEAIHRTITALAKDYPDLFGRFEVTSNYPYPFSRRLEDVLHKLGQSQLLAILNPSFAYYSVDETAKNTIRIRIWDKLFNEEEHKILEEAASRLFEVTKTDI